MPNLPEQKQPYGDNIEAEIVQLKNTQTGALAVLFGNPMFKPNLEQHVPQNNMVSADKMTCAPTSMFSSTMGQLCMTLPENGACPANTINRNSIPGIPTEPNPSCVFFKP